jgi:Flp pilus assembly pilin Flp
MQQLVKFLNAKSGATAIEYAFLASGIALFIMVVVFALGGQVSNSLTVIADAIGA